MDMKLKTCVAALLLCVPFNSAFSLGNLRVLQPSVQLGFKQILQSCSSCSKIGKTTRIQMTPSGEDEERELTNEECEILNLPFGTKLIGEMSESMKLRLDKKKQGTYEKTNGLRYFGNEKFRKENYFGKQKLQVNVERMTKKMRRAEIEERMDAGYSYEAAVKEVDQLMKARAAELAVADVEEQELADSLKELFVAVDRDRSGTISAGEMATAFQRMRGKGSNAKQVLQDVYIVLQEMDLDGSGEIDFEEFKRAAAIFTEMQDGSGQQRSSEPGPEPTKNWFQSFFNM